MILTESEWQSVIWSLIEAGVRFEVDLDAREPRLVICEQEGEVA